ncbi:uncharacterized protein PGTG_00612 [Puccinia graminis f. sp. tritici CRL 75-36-700-3]|uniref:Uncharacterized protein n=1 Tax=Puccinia graminis f. sp. tritici (strain CRL 75-36-700-3 / race SCCL) TaxID=418459 RepID=E3JQC7_PUCGT|nr:uncharacterized protein PGTG_00612 [Puccinia graminis f. sp. tritici CRL 75-36-700-3]EFP74656.2 hypothetical protein PGTG_00612 [Puccinia graminis f. sp. tritici CRL 75-36-700-3]
MARSVGFPMMKPTFNVTPRMTQHGTHANTSPVVISLETDNGHSFTSTDATQKEILILKPHQAWTHGDIHAEMDTFGYKTLQMTIGLVPTMPSTKKNILPATPAIEVKNFHSWSGSNSRGFFLSFHLPIVLAPKLSI